MEIVKKAEKLLGDCEVVDLATVSENGYPRICALSKIKTEGIRKIWFATGTESKKTLHLNKNPKSSVCFWKNGDSVTLVGETKVLTDARTKEELWQDWFIDHFPEGMTDPGYCILEFTAKEATLWIDQEFITVAVI